MAVKITGAKTVQFNLNKEILKIRGRTKAGLRAAALIVKRDSVKITPIDTSNLRGSAYTETGGTIAMPTATIGYTAAYAPFVHEIKKNYKAPGTDWKFLERSLKKNEQTILKTIARFSKV